MPSNLARRRSSSRCRSTRRPTQHATGRFARSRLLRLVAFSCKYGDYGRTMQALPIGAAATGVPGRSAPADHLDAIPLEATADPSRVALGDRVAPRDVGSVNAAVAELGPNS